MSKTEREKLVFCSKISHTQRHSLIRILKVSVIKGLSNDAEG